MSAKTGTTSSLTASANRTEQQNEVPFSIWRGLTRLLTHLYQLAEPATLDAFGAISQAELCRRTSIDRSDMNAVVNALEAEDMVTRVSDPDETRSARAFQVVIVNPSASTSPNPAVSADYPADTAKTAHSQPSADTVLGL